LKLWQLTQIEDFLESFQQKFQSYAGGGSSSEREPVDKFSSALTEYRNQCNESKILLNFENNFNPLNHLLGLKLPSASQSAKTSSKLTKTLWTPNFPPRKPRRLIEEVQDISPKVPKSSSKQRVKKLKKPKLWEIELGPNEAPIKIDNWATTSLSKLKDIQRKRLPAKKKENITQVVPNNFWGSMSEFSNSPIANSSTKSVQDENRKNSDESERPSFFVESDKDDFFRIKKKRLFSPSKSKQPLIRSFCQ
jgi:hypothetical protein